MSCYFFFLSSFLSSFFRSNNMRAMVLLCDVSAVGHQFQSDYHLPNPYHSLNHNSWSVPIHILPHLCPPLSPLSIHTCCNCHTSPSLVSLQWSLCLNPHKKDCQGVLAVIFNAFSLPRNLSTNVPASSPCFLPPHNLYIVPIQMTHRQTAMVFCCLALFTPSTQEHRWRCMSECI